MPSSTNSASWDFNLSDPVHLSATFSFDTEDTQDSAPVATATAAAAIQARIAGATVTATQTDPATITVTVSSQNLLPSWRAPRRAAAYPEDSYGSSIQIACLFIQ